MVCVYACMYVCISQLIVEVTDGGVRHGLTQFTLEFIVCDVCHRLSQLTLVVMVARSVPTHPNKDDEM